MTALLETALGKERYLEEAARRLEEQRREEALDSAFSTFRDHVLPDVFDLDRLVVAADLEAREMIAEHGLGHDDSQSALGPVADLQARYLALLERCVRLHAANSSEGRFLPLTDERRLSGLVACYRDILSECPSIYESDELASKIDDSSIRLDRKEFVPLERWLESSEERG